jgi:CRP-like cAMP-binding protein
MISPELLRRYPFFSAFNATDLGNIAMITEEINVAEGSTLFEEKQAATGLFFLIEGGIDLNYKSEEEFRPKTKKEFPVGEVNPGEVFGISAVIDPYIYNASAKANTASKVLKIDSPGLLELMKGNPVMGYAFMHQIAKATLERLSYTRVQLAAAWA